MARSFVGKFATLLAITVCLSAVTPDSEAARSQAVEGFAEVNGVLLEYIDWGGRGPPLILIHGLADNPHVFDDIAPAFARDFHVIAYARRGSGNSDVKGPYDIDTLTEDLLGLLNAFHIQKADLVGYSAGGDEITNFAGKYPNRVNHIIYLDSAYDWNDPDFLVALKALPGSPFERPASAMASLDSYLTYERATSYPELSARDMERIDADLRAKVILKADGTLRLRIPKSVIEALYAAQRANGPRQYTRIHCPALAIYTETLDDLNVADPGQRKAILRFQEKYWKPFQNKSIDRIRRELAGAQIVKVAGSHGNVLLTNREEVASVMRRFLQSSSQSSD